MAMIIMMKDKVHLFSYCVFLLSFFDMICAAYLKSYRESAVLLTSCVCDVGRYVRQMMMMETVASTVVRSTAVFREVYPCFVEDADALIEKSGKSPMARPTHRRASIVKIQQVSVSGTLAGFWRHPIAEFGCAIHR